MLFSASANIKRPGGTFITTSNFLLMWYLAFLFMLSVWEGFFKNSWNNDVWFRPCRVNLSEVFS
jgi:hypothetical protein